MSSMFNKIKGFFVGDDYDYDDEYDEIEDEIVDSEMEDDDTIEPVISNSKKNNKVVNIHTSASAKVVISKPLAYDDATEISDALKNRKIVVINTSSLENRVAQRLLDFISGSCYALSGELQEIEKGVYLLSPSNVEVTNELKTELTSKALFNFSR